MIGVNAYIAKSMRNDPRGHKFFANAILCIQASDDEAPAIARASYS